METLKITGIISNLTEVQTYNTKDGNQKHVRTMVITTDEQYPKSLLVNVKAESLIAMPLANGMNVTAYLSPRIRTSKQGLIFNEIDIWKLDIIQHC